MDETWLYYHDTETKQQSIDWRHSGSPRPATNNSESNIHWKSSRLDFLGSRQHAPHWISSKGQKYQRGVLLISAGAIEGHFKEKGGENFINVFLFLHENAPAHQPLVTQKKLAYLGFQCLVHPHCSPDLPPSNYNLFPGLKNNWNVVIFCPTRRSLLPQRPGLTDKFLNFL